MASSKKPTIAFWSEPAPGSPLFAKNECRLYAFTNKLAAEFLANHANPDNRSIKESRRKSYTSLMVDLNFPPLTPISLNTEGTMDNGHHRMHAVTFLPDGVVVYFWVMFGTSPKNFALYDGPESARTGGDGLHTEYKLDPIQATLLSSAIKWLVLFENSHLEERSALTNVERVEYARNNPFITKSPRVLTQTVKDALKQVLEMKKKKVGIQPGVALALILLGCGVNKTKMFEFIKNVTTGVFPECAEDHPCYLLRERYQKDKAKRVAGNKSRGVSGSTNLKLGLIAFRMFLEGKTGDKLRTPVDGVVPRLSAAQDKFYKEKSGAKVVLPKMSKTAVAGLAKAATASSIQ